MKTEDYVLPAYWASYLLNNDSDSIGSQEKDEVNKWLDQAAINFSCLSVSDHPFYSRTNDAKKLGGDCLVYTFRT